MTADRMRALRRLALGGALRVALALVLLHAALPVGASACPPPCCPQAADEASGSGAPCHQLAPAACCGEPGALPAPAPPAAPHACTLAPVAAAPAASAPLVPDADLPPRAAYAALALVVLRL
jgi:hypothetical protein